MKLGVMVWQIPGQVGLNFYDQIRWVKENGFDEVSFHTTTHLCAGTPYQGEGFDANNYSGDDLKKLKDALQGFAMIDIHAPFDNFDVTFTSPNPRVIQASLDEVEQTLKLAKAVGAETVTVHSGGTLSGISSEEQLVHLKNSLRKLDELAGRYGVKIGAEITSDYEILEEIDAKNVGLTLDVGHMLKGGGGNYSGYGTIGAVVRRYAKYVYHMHIHDCEGQHDHQSIGKGTIDFKDVVKSLCEINFKGSMCLELDAIKTTAAEALQFAQILRDLQK